MKIIDNFLPDYYHQQIQSVMLGDMFPWHYVPGVQAPDDPPGSYMFYHLFHDDRVPLSQRSPYYKLIEPLVNKLGVDNYLWRVKSNLYPRTLFRRRTNWHVDIPGEKMNTAIYYVNTNNGWTRFKKGDRVKSIANRMVIFPGDQLHAGTYCTDEKVRCVINFNYD
tara:strand:+ start:108 stop:602 length:495 start_codon:yes stop_codon:yes gene_type:complete